MPLSGNRETSKIRAWPGPQPATGPTRYHRERDLPRLIPLYAEDMITATRDSQEKLVALLRRALRQERVRGQSADWCYDLARHRALLRAYRAELDAFLALAPNARARASSDQTESPPRFADPIKML